MHQISSHPPQKLVATFPKSDICICHLWTANYLRLWSAVSSLNVHPFLGLGYIYIYVGQCVCVWHLDDSVYVVNQFWVNCRPTHRVNRSVAYRFDFLSLWRGLGCVCGDRILRSAWVCVCVYDTLMGVFGRHMGHIYMSDKWLGYWEIGIWAEVGADYAVCGLYDRFDGNE